MLPNLSPSPNLTNNRVFTITMLFHDEELAIPVCYQPPGANNKECIYLQLTYGGIIVL